jgi:tRNA-dihydrouridine synthase B
VLHPLDELSPNPVLMAPMVGLSHFAVRAAVHSYLNPGQKALWPTEMLSSRRVPHQKPNQNPEIYFYDKENGLCPQLLANEESAITQSVHALQKWGACAIDINMGCPVKKALKHNYGVALMGDPNYAAEVVRMTVRAAQVPVSVKLRAVEPTAYNTPTPHPKNLNDFVENIFAAGASWVTIHPRTPSQQRRGDADWSQIRHLKNTLGPQSKIIGNGDIQCHEDILRMFDETGCDRVMIGRAILAKPWLINATPDPDPYTQGRIFCEFLLRTLSHCESVYPLDAGMRRMRFLVVYAKSWLEFGETLYGQMHKCKDYTELRTSILRFFQTKQKMVKRTTLRQ